jgi:glutathione S-transferase
MILVGQYDSPFVRRVAVTLHHFGIPFTRNRLSVFNPGMADINPLVRIPSLIIDGGEALFDSSAILDYLDELAGPERALIPRLGDERRRVLQTTVLAAGTIEKTGAVVYERHFHPVRCIAHDWVARCLGQLAGALVHLDGHAKEPWYFGQRMTQADVTIGCMVFYFGLRLPEAFPSGRYPRLEQIARRCEMLDSFINARPSADEVMPPRG